MKSLSVSIDEQVLRHLRVMAQAEGLSVEELIQLFLLNIAGGGEKPLTKNQWNRQFDKLLRRVRRKTSSCSPQEIEADITLASRELRRRRTHAARRG